ncbi:MAG: tyrosine-type recombinase/integrase [Solidesulfovibrio sp. DCME]|uniref:tyrosine-type recombinase/integrase n=1 Tax=Solidesulfovibrio sp. DCME TaxID=3447380 RepID=UPI003D0F3FA0
MPLSDTKLRGIKSRSTAFRLADERGLYVEVTPSGSKLWRFRYKLDGREGMLALGKYPEISLKEARTQREKLREQVAHGIDPAATRRTEKKAALKAESESFEAIAREWHSRKSVGWIKGHAEKILRRFEIWAFPWIGSRPIRDITPPELLAILRRVEASGAIETAHRLQQVCGQVFRYGVACGYCERDPAADVRGALAASMKRHHPAVTDPRDVAALLGAIDSYTGGTFVVRCALRLAPLVFVRPGELRQAEWSEFDIDVAEWRIPAEKMKMKSKHLVPLSWQAVAILRELQPLTGQGRYLFPSERGKGRCMSDATLLNALRRMGYSQDEMTVHGFRTMASTMLHEHGWPSDVIERQLAHIERNKVKAAYNHAEYLPDRRRMMQSWADYLDSLRLIPTGNPFLLTTTAPT